MQILEKDNVVLDYFETGKGTTVILIHSTVSGNRLWKILMEELGKINRNLGKQDENAPHQTFLVVDATTGGNALNQAREFNRAVPLSGVIVTKLDGSGKGGVAVAIQRELDIAPRFIGTGEEPEQFEVFSRTNFVSQVL